MVGYSPWGHKESDTTERLHFTNAGDTGSVPDQEDPLEQEMATHSSILIWEILWL